MRMAKVISANTGVGIGKRSSTSSSGRGHSQTTAIVDKMEVDEEDHEDEREGFLDEEEGWIIKFLNSFLFFIALSSLFLFALLLLFKLNFDWNLREVK